MGNIKEKLSWSVTPWQIFPDGKWQTQPVILVEGRVPFFADRPEDYIKELERLHDDPELLPGSFHTMIGQFKDALDNHKNRAERRRNK